jgi:hypothetical protein
MRDFNDGKSPRGHIPKLRNHAIAATGAALNEAAMVASILEPLLKRLILFVGEG